MKKLFLILFILPLFCFGQTRVKITQQETVELFPHTIDSGLGTEASPYINADSTAGIKTKLAVLSAGRGGTIKLSANRFNIDSVIRITHSGIRIESVVAGYNADSNAVKQGINATTLICKKGGFSISGTGYPIGRTGGVFLSSVYLFGTKPFQSTNATSGTVGVQLNSFVDQPTLRNVNMGGFDYGIKSVNSSLGWVDFTYFQQVEVQGGRVGAYYDNAGLGNFGQHFIACAFAETKEHNFYVTSSSTNENFVFSGTAFYRGSWATGVTNPANVYFAGTRSRFEGCEFVAAGYNLNAGTHVQADGLILAGSYNAVSGCAFLDNSTSGSAGIRITGNNNIISGCTFNNNSTDIVITGNNNIVYAPVGATISDSGTGNTIISEHLLLKPTVSDGVLAKGMGLTAALTPTAINVPLYGLDIVTSYVAGISTVGITNAGSSYTNGTYTNVPLNSAVQGTGALATVVISGGSVSTVTVTTAGSGYKLGGTVTILASSVGGTGTGFSSYITALSPAGGVGAGLRVDGIPIGTGWGAGMNFDNIAIGKDVLIKNTTGGSGGGNTALGSSALKFNTTGSANTAVGVVALSANTTGSDNTAVGINSGVAMTTGSKNSFYGSASGLAYNTGSFSTAIGWNALHSVDANNNTGVGYNAGGSYTSGTGNVSIGASSAVGISSGSGNTILGFFSGNGLTSCSSCTIIGSQMSGYPSTTPTSIIILADGAGNERMVQDAVGRTVFQGNVATWPTIPASSFHTISSAVTTMGTIPWTQTTTTQRNAISSPAEALTTYDLTLHSPYFHNGSAWQQYNGTVASADLTAQTSTGNVTTFTVGSSTATFNISSYINVTAVSVDVIQGQVTYTDENNTAQTISLANLSAIGNSTYSPITIRAKNATVITVKTNLTTGAGSITFDTGATITKL